MNDRGGFIISANSTDKEDVLHNTSLCLQSLNTNPMPNMITVLA